MANEPLATGVLEPSLQLQNNNADVASTNATIGGLLAGLQAAVTTSGTSANTILKTATIPAGQNIPNALAQGQILKVTAWGVNSGDANAKTITLAYATAGSIALAVTLSSAPWYVQFLIQNVGTATTPAWTAVGWAQISTGTTAAFLLGSTSGSDNIATGPLNITLSATAATAGTMTVNGALVEIVK